MEFIEAGTDHWPNPTGGGGGEEYKLNIYHRQNLKSRIPYSE
jgi:hypothetical protein